MQYGVDIREYKRIGYSEKNKTKEEPLELISFFVVGILISRVVIFLNQGNALGIAPFGLAYLLVVMMMKEERKMISAILGVSVGYISISSSMSDRYINILSIILLSIYFVIQVRMDKKIKELDSFMIVFCAYFIYGFFISKYDVGLNLTLSLVNTVIIIPIYYIIK